MTLMIRKSKANHSRTLFRENIKSPKEFWKKIKQIYPKENNSANVKMFKIDQEPVIDKQKISNSFCSFFTNVASTLKGIVCDIGDKAWKHKRESNLKAKINPEGKKFQFTRVKETDVLKILKNLNTSKAAGIDNVPPKMLKDAADELSAPLCSLINKSLQASLFPTSEKCGKITPVLKSGNPTLLDNYRPITVIPALSKFIEKIIYNQLSQYLESNGLLCPRQFGFRQGRCTQHAVTLLSEKVRQNIDKGLCTGAVYIDLRKAFDTVRHATLLEKLPSYGIDDVELQWIGDYLFNRKQIVIFDNTSSCEENVTCGVPQGSILGPLLFGLIINDIHIPLTDADIILYADDTILYCAGKNANEIEHLLNNELQKVAGWLDENNLFINLKKGKTEFVLYGSHQKLSKQPNVEIKIYNQTIHETKSYKYLGVDLDNHLNLHQHFDNVYKKASARVKLLSRIREKVSPYVAESIYKSMIRPLLLYCYPLQLSLPQGTVNKLQYIQNRAARIVNPSAKITTWDSIEKTRNTRVVIDVFKSLHNLLPEDLNGYFKKM